MSESESLDEDVRVGASVARFRVARGLSQVELAEHIGVAQQTIAKIEKGIRPLKYSEASRIASALRVSVGSFSARPENVISQSNAIALQNDLNKQNERLADVAGYLASLYVNIALEIATDRARPPEYRAPELQQIFYSTVLDSFDTLPEKFNRALADGVRSSAKRYGVRATKSDRPSKILQEIAQLQVEFNEPALASMDGLAGWIDESDT